MGIDYNFVLEYDGDDPDRYEFVGEIEEVCRSHFREWSDMHGNDIMSTSFFGRKDISLQTKEMLDEEWSLTQHWTLNKIPIQIKELIKEMRDVIESDDELAKYELKTLLDAANGLQLVYEGAMELCVSHKLKPEKCYVAWWTS